MSRRLYLLSVLVSIFLFDSCKKEVEKLDLKTDENISYFGQKTPGTIAKIFAAETVSVKGRYEYAVSFTPKFDEMYFSGNLEDQPQKVYFSRLINNKWTAPKEANFTKGNKKNELEAFVSPKGDKIFFAAYDSIFSDENIWYVDRFKSAWSEAKKLNSPVNDDLVFYSNTASNGDLYYTSISKWKMFYAPNKNGSYPEVREVSIEYGGHGYIAPNQDFILVDAPKDNDPKNDRDIYVYFKKKDDTWSHPINLGEGVNSNFSETCPSLTPDGKYLFFSRYDEEDGVSNIYWVSAEVLNKVKPTNLDE